MAERLKAFAWKANYSRKGVHGFKSHSLRHCEHMKEEEQILETEDPIISAQNIVRVAQWLEHRSYKSAVVSSILTPHTKIS